MRRQTTAAEGRVKMLANALQSSVLFAIEVQTRLELTTQCVSFAAQTSSLRSLSIKSKRGVPLYATLIIGWAGLFDPATHLF